MTSSCRSRPCGRLDGGGWGGACRKARAPRLGDVCGSCFARGVLLACGSADGKVRIYDPVAGGGAALVVIDAGSPRWWSSKTRWTH